MKPVQSGIRTIALFLSLLIVTLPVTFAEQISVLYDNNGNVVYDGQFNRSYNSFNQLEKVYNASSGMLLQQYTMHPTEERVHVKKTYTNEGDWVDTTIYVSKTFVVVKNSSGVYNFTYVRQDGMLVGQINHDDSKYFIHGDHLGSSTVVTDESATVIENTSYTPFGEVLQGGEESRYGYEGQEHDSVLGDTDFNFRKYKPEWALFLQPDSIIPGIYNPQALNRYMFELGNPYKYVDPDGHFIQFANLVDYYTERAEYYWDQFKEAASSAWQSVDQTARFLLEGTYHVFVEPFVDEADWATSEMLWQMNKDNQVAHFGPRNAEEMNEKRKKALFAATGQVFTAFLGGGAGGSLVVGIDNTLEFTTGAGVLESTSNVLNEFAMTWGLWLSEWTLSHPEQKDEINAALGSEGPSSTGEENMEKEP